MNKYEPTIKSLGEVALWVTDLVHLQEFYTEVLGLTVMKRLSHAAFLRLAKDYGRHPQGLVLFNHQRTLTQPKSAN